MYFSWFPMYCYRYYSWFIDVWNKWVDTIPSFKIAYLHLNCQKFFHDSNNNFNCISRSWKFCKKRRTISFHEIHFTPWSHKDLVVATVGFGEETCIMNHILGNLDSFNFLLRLCTLSTVYVRVATRYPNREEWYPHWIWCLDWSREHTKKWICQSSKCIRNFILVYWVKYQLSVSWISIFKMQTWTIWH